MSSQLNSNEEVQMAMLAQGSGDTACFEIPGRASARDVQVLRSEMRRAMQAGGRRLVVNFEAVSQFDVKVLSSIVQCANACRQHGVSFEVANVSAELRADLRALQLHERLGLD